MSMRYKRDIINETLLVFHENHDKKYPLAKVEEFCKYSFGDICSQHLIAPPYMWS